MKERKDVIAEFNELVNMTASELEEWLKSDDSNSAGWPKGDDGGDADGESVGHDSGRKIVEILKSNPDKAEDKYSDDDVEHMRKVVAYCKRHLAQEKGPNSKKSAEELKKTKSYASLKNWGHDFLKAQDKATTGDQKENEAEQSEQDAKEAGADEKADEAGDATEAGDAAAEEQADAAEEAAEDEKADEEMEDKEEENGDAEYTEETEQSQPGEKRKTRSGQAGSNKRQQTKKGGDSNGANKQSEEKDNDGKQEEQDDAGETEEAAEQAKPEEDSNGNGDGKNGPEEGDTVSWKWGAGHPEGKVLDVKDEKTTITTKRGNKVSRDGSKEDPAVVLDTGKSKAIKLAHELD